MEVVCIARDRISARSWRQGNIRYVLPGFCVSMLKNEVLERILRDTHLHIIILHTGKLCVQHNN